MSTAGLLRYAPPATLPMPLPSLPPKTTFGGDSSPEGRRITKYMDSVRDLLTLPTSSGPVGLHLSIGLPTGSDLLTHHDLDNFLEPLATHIGPACIGRASATKAIGFSSMLSLGPVEVAASEPEGKWSTATLDGPGLSDRARREFGRSLVAHAAPLPWGPVELEIATRLGSHRNLVSAWKRLIDALVPILGRAPGKAEFDIEDGRITTLVINQEIDHSLGDQVQARLWWRLAGPAVGGGPSLSYDPFEAPSATARDRPAVARASPDEQSAGRPSEIELITTLKQLQDVQNRRAGFVVITDTASPARIHRAGCPGVKESNFIRKVIDNQMRNGKYFHAGTAEAANSRWPRLSAHSCV